MTREFRNVLHVRENINSMTRQNSEYNYSQGFIQVCVCVCGGGGGGGWIG